jgi:uncharacterized damage-inducible protein DinB
MSANREFFAKCWSNEIATFVRVLKALPSDRLDYRPHEKNTPAGALAWQLATEAANLNELLDTGVINFELTKHPKSSDEIAAEFEKEANGVKERLATADDAKWASAGDFRMGGKSMWSTSVQDLCWGYLFDMIHHRGQLSAYIRPMGGKVPQIYGPSADDSGQG